MALGGFWGLSGFEGSGLELAKGSFAPFELPFRSSRFGAERLAWEVFGFVREGGGGV